MYIYAHIMYMYVYMYIYLRVFDDNISNRRKKNAQTQWLSTYL